MDEPNRNSYFDEALRHDLTLIDEEIARRKMKKPFEPYAAWAMMARIEAMARFEGRTEVRA